MSWRLVLALLACLVVAACADNGGGGSDDSGKDRFGGFYTGGNLGGGISR